MEQITDTYIQNCRVLMEKRLLLVKKILAYDEKQMICLTKKDFEEEVYRQLQEKEDECLKKLSTLNEEYDTLYAKGQEVLKEKDGDPAAIRELENLLARLEKASGKLEQSQRQKDIMFKSYVGNQRRKIKDYKFRRTAAAKYYNNMVGHVEGSAYYYDKSK